MLHGAKVPQEVHTNTQVWEVNLLQPSWLGTRAGTRLKVFSKSSNCR